VRAASIPLITRRNTGFFARYRRSPNILDGFFGIVGSLHRVSATVKDREGEGSLLVRIMAAADGRAGLSCLFVNRASGMKRAVP
jgi:hypothetical protein